MGLPKTSKDVSTSNIHKFCSFDVWVYTASFSTNDDWIMHTAYHGEVVRGNLGKIAKAMSVLYPDAVGFNICPIGMREPDDEETEVVCAMV